MNGSDIKSRDSRNMNKKKIRIPDPNREKL